MHAQLKDWKLAAESLCSACVFDHVRAAQLALDIMGQSPDPDLRQTAADAEPYLRAACAKTADRHRKETAQRRFAAIRDALHVRAGGRFGRRGTQEAMTPEERYRNVLELPLGRRLFGPEISRAYKQAAKKAHPDGGGSENAFLEVIAARDALMKAL